MNQALVQDLLNALALEPGRPPVENIKKRNLQIGTGALIRAMKNAEAAIETVVDQDNRNQWKLILATLKLILAT